MRFFAALSLFALAFPALAAPSTERQELTPAPVSVVPRTFFEGGSACNDYNKAKKCFDIGNDCNEWCICIPVKQCPYYKEFLCKLGKGTFTKNGCSCVYPTVRHGGGWGYGRKRSFTCPTGLTSCLIDPSPSSSSSSSTSASSRAGKSECLDTLSSIDSCGGCTSEGAGQDCTTIPNVADVSCEGGRCQVFSCDKGFKVENGTSCVEDLSVGSAASKGFVVGALKGAEKFWGY